ncbi:nephrocystin-1-like, partial [Plakobranchus ocellatus]
VDQTVKESNKLIGNKKAKDKDVLLQQMYQNCIDTKTLVEDHSNLVENLKEDEEPHKIKDFEKKRTAELNRCTVMKTQLTETMAKLLPDITETEFIKTHGNKEEKEKDESEKNVKGADKDKEEEEEEEEDDDEEEEEEEEDEDEEDEEDEEEESVAEKSKLQSVQQKKSVAEEEEAEEDDDEDEEEEDDDDEEEEEEETEVKRPIQLKGAKKAAQEDQDEDEEEEEDDEDEEEEEDEEDEDEKEEKEESASKAISDKKSKDKKKGKSKSDTLEVTESTHRFTTVDDYEGEEGDLNFTKGDILTVLETREDGWWLAQNEAGEKGLVPSTYLQKLDTSADQEDDEEDEDEEQEADDGSPEGEKGKKLWGSLRKALTETSVSDVLHAMGAVPSGFRMSTLCRKFNEGDTFRMASFLTPKLSHSNLSYRDLFFNPATNKIRPRSTRIERVITLVSGLQIPPPGAGIEVLDRHVRMCLFDGHHILSNIHSVKVGSVDKSQRSWAFTTKTSEQMDVHSHAEVFVRTNDTMDNIGLLCELCVTYCRTSSKEKGEFSCGWTLMPLLDEAGAVVMNKTFDLRVNGGTPYEKGVEVDPSISRRTTSNALVSLISGNKQPRLALRVSIPKQQHKDLMDTLPDTLVGNTCLLQLMSLYRQSLCDVLLRDRLDLTSTELIHGPVLKGFPQTADIPDLMKLFRAAWYEKLRDVKRTERRDAEFMKELFRLTYLESVYPVSHLASLPAFRMGDHDNQALRSQEMKRFTEMKTVGKGALSTLLSPDFQWEPLDLDEMAFNIIGPHCLQKTVAAGS